MVEKKSYDSMKRDFEEKLRSLKKTLELKVTIIDQLHTKVTNLEKPNKEAKKAESQKNKDIAKQNLIQFSIINE